MKTIQHRRSTSASGSKHTMAFDLDRRRWPIGADVIGPELTHFRVWAPRRRRIELLIEGSITDRIPLAPEDNGYFSSIAKVGADTLYRFRLDGGDTLYPDPA